ncbi:dTDP-4-dehydrorhamnose reductase [Maricaulis sp. CAU 1757]
MARSPLVLVFGRTGQVARETVSRAAKFGLEVQALSRDDVDLTDVEAVRAAVLGAPTETVAVFNAAAYTQVDQAEADAEAAQRVNSDAPGAMAAACAKRGVGFIHISTDYVFDGTRGEPYRETDPVAPLGVYGRSKLSGETAVLSACPDALVLRTAWVFSRHGRNFVTTMLRLAQSRSELRVVDDQRGCPTPAGSIADAALELAGRMADGQSVPGGVFHFAGDQPVSWKEFAETIFDEWRALGHEVPTVAPIASKDYPTAAARPANSVLNCEKIERELGLRAAAWREALKTDLLFLANNSNSGD